MLDFSLGEMHEAARSRARAALAPLDAHRARLREIVLRRMELPPEIWTAFAESGFFRSLVPTAYGGSGESLLSALIAMEEMTSAGYFNELPVLTAISAIAIARCGSDVLKQSVLPSIARGEAKVAFAATEEKAGFNIFNTETRAERRGDRFVVNGRKVYTSGADIADWLLLIARTRSLEDLKANGLPKTLGLTVLLVDARAPGIRRTRINARGELGTKTFITEYADVEVPLENVVGEPDQGMLALFHSVNAERALVAAGLVGVSEHCLRIACEHARTRKVFRGAPIGQYQAIQHPLAEVKMRQEAVRQMAYKAAWAHDRGLGLEETAFYANTAKYLGAELGLKAVDAAIDALGGRGFEEEHGLIYLWEAVRLAKSAPVSGAMILNFVAEHTLGLPRSY